MEHYPLQWLRLACWHSINHCDINHCDVIHCDTNHCDVNHCDVNHDRINRYHVTKADVDVVEADLAEARRSVAFAKRQMEDPTVAMKYLSNVLKHPDDARYRTLKISNRREGERDGLQRSSVSFWWWFRPLLSLSHSSGDTVPFWLLLFFFGGYFFCAITAETVLFFCYCLMGWIHCSFYFIFFFDLIFTLTTQYQYSWFLKSATPEESPHTT